MFWFGKSRKTSASSGSSEGLSAYVDLLLTRVAADQLVFLSRRRYPMQTRLFLNTTSSGLERPRPTGMEVTLVRARAASGGLQEYSGRVQGGTPGRLQWLEEVRDQGTLTVANRAHYVFLHLDQRCEQRSHHSFQVISPDLVDYKALTSDISASGLRLQTSTPRDVHETMRLTLNLDQDGFTSIKVMGEVVWCTQRDTASWWVGIQFVDLTAADIKALRAYIDFVDGYAKRSFRGG